MGQKKAKTSKPRLSRPKTPKAGPDRAAQEARQPPLIPLSEDELREASRNLADVVGRLADLKVQHALDKKGMRMEEEKLEERIAGLASTIRTQGR